jgi:hypothetical protein
MRLLYQIKGIFSTQLTKALKAKDSDFNQIFLNFCFFLSENISSILITLIVLGKLLYL